MHQLNPFTSEERINANYKYLGSFAILRATNQDAFKQRSDWIVNANRSRFYGARKTIGPIKDSAIEWVSFELIEIVMARDYRGIREYLRIVLGDIAAFGQPLSEVF